MTPAQRLTLTLLEREGFKQVLEIRDIVRVTRHGECRVILPDGTQKRGHHASQQNDRQRNAGTYQPKGKPRRRDVTQWRDLTG